MDSCTLNNDTYNVAVVFIRESVGAQEIPLEYISELRISNDSYDPFPRAVLIIKDPKSTIIPLYAADNKSSVIITIQTYEHYDDKIITIEKTHAFNINRVKPLNFDGISNTYELSLTSIHIKDWANCVSYSTGSTLLSSTVVIRNLLSAANIPNTEPKLHSIYNTSYICDINTPVSDHVNRLLDLASIDGGGFYYPWFNVITNKLEIDSILGRLNRGPIKMYNQLVISSDESGSVDYLTPRSVEYTNDISATQMDRISKGFTEVGLDYNSGKETEKNLTYQDIVNGSTYTNYVPVIDNTHNIDIDKNLAQIGSNHNWFKNTRLAVRNYNGAMITILGTNQRMLGDVVSIDTSKSLNATFNGLWLIQRTTDIFKFGAGKFEQILLVGRVAKSQEN